MQEQQRPVCYVCGNAVRENAVYIGQGLYRHPSRCKPGSKRYMENKALLRLYRRTPHRPPVGPGLAELPPIEGSA